MFSLRKDRHLRAISKSLPIHPFSGHNKRSAEASFRARHTVAFWRPAKPVVLKISPSGDRPKWLRDLGQSPIQKKSPRDHIAEEERRASAEKSPSGDRPNGRGVWGRAPFKRSPHGTT